MDATELGRAADLVRRGGVLVLTGAGLSTDSGIPDFRSAGGLWERYPIEEYATLEGFRADPRKVWRFFAELERTLAAARPNPGHQALAELEAAGLVIGIVTQNIDALHQAAGSREVVEFHGSGARLACIACGARTAPRPGDAVPTCACGQILKPDVVLFGELIPPAALQRSAALLERTRTVLVCGTSANVYPAAAIPQRALDAGAALIEVNLEPTALSRLAAVSLRGRTSAVLPELARLATA